MEPGPSREELLRELHTLRHRLRDAEAALAASRRHSTLVELDMHARVLESMAEGVGVADDRGLILYTNPAEDAMFGYESGELWGKHVAVLVPCGPEEAAQQINEINAAMAAGPIVREIRNCRKDGSEFTSQFTISWLEMVGKKYAVWVREDVTERQDAERALRSGEVRLRALLEALPDLMLRLDVKGIYLDYHAPQPEGLYPPPEAFLGKLIEDVLPSEVALQFRDYLVRTLETGKSQTFEYSLELPRRGRRVLEVHMAAVAEVEVVAIVRDVTDRRRLEEEFRQIQKMEAVGRLAGGVAHDFNNLLTIISGYSDILLDDLPPADPHRDIVSEIRTAGLRAAILTRQLLAFSRKTVLEPRVLDVNLLIGDMGKMLRRLIGEDIEMTTVLAPDLGKIKLDPGRLEQVLVNLAVNARDAMPNGGRFTVETRNVVLDEDFTSGVEGLSPGPHILLAVSDTGVGMTEGVKSRIFEPFFTTKEPGKGTGLGLSMVYGFVKQSAGHVIVYSEPNRGTTFKIYLPREENVVEHRPAPVTRRESPTGTETILVVEDEEGVRALIRQVLSSRGYTVLEAEHGREAIRVARRHTGPIHLLLTDVVMPQMGGRPLAEVLQAQRPRLKVLFLSGYTDDAVVGHGILEEGTEFLNKPFSPSALSEKVRQVLDAV